MTVVDEVIQLAFGFLVGLTSSAAFILALFIGVCTLFGLVKLKRTAGHSPVIKSLDEVIAKKQLLKA